MSRQPPGVRGQQPNLQEPPTYAEVILEDLRMHQTYRSDDIMSHQGPPPKPAPAPKPSGLATKHPVNLLDDDLPVGDLLTYEFGPTLPPPLLPLPPSGALPSSRDPFDVAPVTSGPSRPLPTLPSHTAYAGAPSVTATAYAGAPSVTARQKPTLPQKPVGHAAAQQVAPPVPAARHNCWVSFDGQEQPPVLPRRQSLSQDRLSAAGATVAPPRSATHGSLEQLAAPTAAVRKTSLTEGRKKVAPRPPPPTTKQKPTVLRPTKPRTTGKPPAARGSLRAKSSSVKTNAPPPRPPSTYLSSQSFNRRGSTRSAGTASSSSSSFNPPQGVQPHTAGRSKQDTALDWGTETTSASNLPPRPGPGHPLYHYTVTGPHGIVLHDFVGQQADELSFTTGDVIEILEKVDDDWMKGKNVNKTGIFPKSYIRVVIPLPQKAAPRAAAQHHGVVIGPRCRARFDFDAEQDDELAFSEGATIALRERVSNDWLRGELAGRTGIFPSVYVEIVEDLPREVVQRSCAGRVATAMYDFDGRENELTFKQGDEVTLVSKVNDDWLVGHFHGNEGRFPAAFVDHVPIDLPLEDAVAVATKAAAPASKHAVALYSFDAGSASELSLRSGDKVVITGSVNEDWLIGRVNGKEGSFPASFVEIKADQPVKFRVRSASETPPVRSSGTARAVYDFVSEPGELSFKAGDVIQLVEEVDKDWMVGMCHGHTGMFPVNFVEILDPL